MSRSGRQSSIKKPRGGCKLIIRTVDDMLTCYLPPSPLPEDVTDDVTDDVTEGITALQTSYTVEREPPEEADKKIEGNIPTPDSTPTKDHPDTYIAKVSESPHTIQLVPTNPDQDDSDFHPGKENQQSHDADLARDVHPQKGRLKGQERVIGHCDSPQPTRPKQTKNTAISPHTDSSRGRKGRQGRGRLRKSASSKTTSTTAPAVAGKNKSTASSTRTAPKKAPVHNHLLTDYFPIRRSERRTTTDLKKAHQAELEEAILKECVDGLKVVDIAGKGRGIVATKNFSRGDFVVEYAGDLISHATAKDREKKYAANPEFGCYMYYFMHNNKSYCIDATAESGKLGRLLNHSCKTPNCATKVVTIKENPYLILIAARDIEIGEELLYDYGDRSKESLAAHPWLAL